VQHSATHSVSLQHSAAHCSPKPMSDSRNISKLGTRLLANIVMHITFQTTQYTATKCNKVWHTSTHCNTLHSKPYVTHCNTLQHTAAHCSTLQHPATHCILNRMQACLRLVKRCCSALQGTRLESSHSPSLKFHYNTQSPPPHPHKKNVRGKHPK